MEEERIIFSAAIKRLSDGRILTGRTHCDIYDKWSTIDKTLRFNKGDSEMGFVDQYGNFYTRKEAGEAIGKINAVHQDTGRKMDVK